METTKSLLQYDTYDESTGTASVIIVAAGSSTRMGGVSKQLLSVGGIPVIARTLLAFQRAACIKNIVLVARECDILDLQKIAEKYMITKLTDIVEGGNCREESVKNGVLRLAKDSKTVLIHDGARPLVTQEVISAVADAAEKFLAATCAVPVKDTLKVVEDGIITDTLERAKIYSAQTPQGFSYPLFKNAIESIDDLSQFTDDCAVVESKGTSVHIVLGDYNNIKITTKEDVLIAEEIVKRGECDD